MCFEIHKFRSTPNISYNRYFILKFELDGLGNASVLFIYFSILRGEPKTPCQPPLTSLVHTTILGPHGHMIAFC